MAEHASRASGHDGSSPVGWDAGDDGSGDGPAHRWRGRTGSVRDLVRQELAARFVRKHLPSTAPARPLQVLDVGCGEGEQTRRLLALGPEVVGSAVGLDVDPRMLAGLIASLSPDDLGRVTAVASDVARAESALAAAGLPAAYDVVLCHGVLMYLPDPAPAVAALARLVRDGGLLSLLVRNQAGIAVRAGHRGRWAEAQRALDGDPTYVNELGATARADTVESISTLVRASELEIVGWYGVRALGDLASLDASARPDELDAGDLAAQLDAEELAGRRDPYRAVAPLVQVIASRPVVF